MLGQKIGKAENGALERGGEACLQDLCGNTGCAGRLCRAQIKLPRLPQPTQHQKRRQQIGQVRRNGDPGDAHAKSDDKGKIQAEIDDTGEHQRPKGRPAVAPGPEHCGTEVIEKQKRVAQQIEPQILRCRRKNLLRRLHPAQQRPGSGLPQEHTSQPQKQGQVQRGLHSGGDLLLPVLPDPACNENIHANGQPSGERHDQGDDLRVDPHGGQRRRIAEMADHGSVRRVK